MRLWKETEYWAIDADVAFLISNNFKKARRGRKRADSDVLYAALGGRKPVATA